MVGTRRKIPFSLSLSLYSLVSRYYSPFLWERFAEVSSLRVVLTVFLLFPLTLYSIQWESLRWFWPNALFILSFLYSTSFCDHFPFHLFSSQVREALSNTLPLLFRSQNVCLLLPLLTLLPSPYHTHPLSQRREVNRKGIRPKASLSFLIGRRFSS